MDMMKCVAHRATMTLDEAKAELEKFVQLKTTMRPTFADILTSADVAEVNRCKTCFHYKPREYGYNCTVLDWDVNEDDFCSRWEAKDE